MASSGSAVITDDSHHMMLLQCHLHNLYKIPFSSIMACGPLMIEIALRLKLGKEVCATGALKALNFHTKVKLDTTRLARTLHPSQHWVLFSLSR